MWPAFRELMDQFNEAVVVVDMNQRFGANSAARFRRALERQVHKWADESNSGFFAVAFLDLVRFRAINDSFGYAASDRLLNEVAGIIADSLDTTDMLARFGGDHFALLIRSRQSLEQAELLVRKILRGLDREFQFGDGRVKLSARAGLATPQGMECSSDSILRDADGAHQQARLTRESIVVSRDPQSAKSILQASLEFDLANALEKDEFFFEFQPVFDPCTGRVRFLEALLRWCHPRLGVISPASFISLAENSGLVLKLDMQGLGRLGRQLDHWHAQNPAMADLPVSINISGRHFPNFVMEKQFHSLLRQPALQRSQIIFEITESVFVEGNRKTSQGLQRLRNAGVQIWLDDFGEGYSSFRYLTHFPIDGIKIASCFTRHCAEQSKSRVVLSSLQALARGLGVEAVVEGVETREQFDTLKTMGFDALQGFYLARPMPANEIPALFARVPGARLAMPRSA